MKSVQALLSVFGLAAAVQATGWNATSTAGTGISYVTETVATYTTFCPAATTITTNGKTYTATASQTLTITDCPCKVTKPVTPPTPTGVAPPPVGNATIITTVLTAYTTVCPVATSVIQGNQTYTATASQTLTITNCPCTVSYPATTSTTVVTTITTYCPSSTVLTFGSSTYSVTSVGTQTIPVTSVSTGPASPPTPAPVAPGTTPGASAPATNKPTSPPASTTGPLQANSGVKAASGFGAVVAGFLALLL